MPPAVLAERVAVALGHGGLTVPQRLRVQNVIHYGTGAGLGVAWESTSHAVFGTALQTVRRTLRPRR
jgi:hypothetical protein